MHGSATMAAGCEKRHKAVAPLSRLGTGRGTAAYITPGHSSLVPLCQSRASFKVQSSVSRWWCRCRFYTVEGVQGVEGEVESGVEDEVEGEVEGVEGVVE